MFSKFLSRALVRGLNHGCLDEAKRGNYEKAVELGRRARRILLERLPEERDDLVLVLGSLGEACRLRGFHGEAEAMLMEGLALMRQGAGGPFYGAQVLNNLALVKTDLGKPEEAEPYLIQAIESWRACDPPSQGNLAISLMNLGMVKLARGDYRASQRNLREALALLAESGARDTYYYAGALNNLGQLSVALGDLEGAVNLQIESLELAKRLLGEAHPYYATSLHNLGLTAEGVGNHELAERCLTEANAILRKSLDPTSPELLRSFDSLGGVKFQLRKYEEAESLIREVYHLRALYLGERHPDTLTSLNNLAVMNSALGRLEEAEQFQRRAAALFRETLGEGHLLYADMLNNLAALCAGAGRLEEADELFQREFDLSNELLAVVSSISSEGQRASYLRSTRRRYQLYLAFLSRFRGEDPKTACRALDLVLRRKAIGAEALLVQWTALLSGRYPELKESLERLLQARQALARALLSTSDLGDPGTGREKIAQLREERERIESELAGELPEMRLDERLREANRTSLAYALPLDSALIELVSAPSCDFNLVEHDWGEERYLAFVLLAGRPDNIAWVDLGPAEKIDGKVQELRHWVTSNSGRDLDGSHRPLDEELRDPGEALRKLVFDPLLPALGGRRRLVIAPDGALGLFPFEVLPVGGGRRLIDDYVISYISVGREALRLAAPTQRRPLRSLVVADPDFDLTAVPRAQVTDEFEPARHPSRELARGLHFSRLEATRAEGKKVAELLGQELWLEDQALEGRLKAWMRENGSPLVLHLATHGFFLEDREPQGASSTLRMAEVTGGPLPESPLLRSGLALAGANTGQEGGALPADAEDGLLLAEDIAGLDFLDTELVVLSACNTGMGQVQIGEGVLGLRRAFAAAGARTLIMSLWRVPDVETQELMEDFYGRLLAGRQPRVEALREAQLALKRRKPHPSYWGAFICQGAPEPLDVPAH